MTIFANVYVGTAPNDNTGDPLRNAFEIINQNFADIATVNLTSPVQTVANRTGNIILGVNDVAGAASTVYAQSYTMGNYLNWQGNVTTIGAALDQLAARLSSANL